MTVGRFAVVLLSVLLLSVISIMTLNFAEKIWLFVIFFGEQMFLLILTQIKGAG